MDFTNTAVEVDFSGGFGYEEWTKHPGLCFGKNGLKT